MSFVEAVQNIPTIADCLQAGLKALGGNREYLLQEGKGSVNGSVDLDGCRRAAEPGASRWDYTIGFNNKAYFVEIHPASGDHIDDVLAKARWLRNLLITEGAPLAAIHADGVFHWIPSGRVGLSAGQRAKLAQQKVVLTSRPLRLR